MCNFLSGLVLQNGDILTHPMLDSHDDLVKYYQLPDRNAYIRRFVKVELTPVEWSDPDTWQWVVDEEVPPAWWGEVAQQTEATLRRRARALIITDERSLIADGCWIVAGEAKVSDVRAGRILRVQDHAQIHGIYGNAQIRNVSGDAKIYEVSGAAQIHVVYGNAQIRDVSGAAQIHGVYGAAQIRGVYGDAQICGVYGTAQIRGVSGDAKIYDVSGAAQIHGVYGNAQIRDVSGAAQIHEIYGAAQIRGVYGDAQICRVYGDALLDESAKRALKS